MATDGDLGAALAVATEAAREAGALLLAEFLRPGGPRGTLAGHAHAHADERAEALIRARLLAATPGWGYLGEETAGTPVAGDGRHLWFVDPNDGTRAYLKGFRGSAVSIGLLRDGVPVLGVVFAYAAPDNRGDLFGWAEGCGPLRRNGQPVDRPPWSAALSAESVVLVSQSADRAALRNLLCSAPARVRAEASVAYRMALVAAGEGEVGASLAGPGGWDYAGGHALLRAVGGALLDQAGRPVTYTRSGGSSTASCFFGAPHLASQIAQRPWGDVLGHPPLAPGVRCWPAPGRTVADAGLLERAQGCLLGQLAGDALGGMVEFSSAAAISRAYPHGPRALAPSPVWHTLAGQPTDDSELALALARTLLTPRGYVDEQAATAYGAWRESRPFDVGGTIGAATGGKARAARAAASQSSQANGALMRQSPLAIWGHAHSPEDLALAIRADTTLTHPHPVCVEASAAYVVALAATIREGLTAEQAYTVACDWQAQHGVDASVGESLAAARTGPPQYERQMGWVLIALRNAFYQALHAPTLEEGIVATVLGGGDTDTNAAIAGALLGALHGARSLPSQWRQAVLTCRPQLDAPGVLQPRPQTYWPVDALTLAEVLLVAGHTGSQAAGAGRQVRT